MPIPDTPKVARTETPQIKPEAIEATPQSEKVAEHVAPPEVEEDTKAETPRHYYRAELH